ncbi:hypothetical protein TNCV_4517501 [Trichonephila clavipes]|nr:hypothetical protein TNCV_4517501 [Trichonephila clavipes]
MAGTSVNGVGSRCASVEEDVETTVVEDDVLGLWCASTRHGVQQGRQCVGQLTIVRLGGYLEYTQHIALQHQDVGPMGKPGNSYLQH